MTTETLQKGPDGHAAEALSLNDAASHLLEECRMVLPGIQALFGFQLIAVFSPEFAQRLSPLERGLHLAAITLVVLSIALVMAPAALHRQAEPRSVSEHFISVSSHLLLWGMMPLALGICADVYLVGRLVLGSRVAAAALASALLGAVGALWLWLPRSRSFHLAGHDAERRPLRREPRT
jgi:uncharacterized protein DUF6328